MSIGNNLSVAIRFLRNDACVAIPTETVYGLAANALSSKAVASIFTIKNRPAFDPLIVHIASIAEAEKYAAPNAEAFLVMEKFWPGPLTVVLPKKNCIPDLVTSGLSTVGLRCPNHPVALELLQHLPFPLAAPSANPFGYVSPTTAQHVEAQLGDSIPYILEGGKCTIGLESTIVGFENKGVVIYRLGGISVEEIEKVLGRVSLRLSGTPLAPGQLDSHYAPRKKLYVGNVQALQEKFPGETLGVIFYSKKTIECAHPIVLSPGGELEEAAQNLFAALREMDNSDATTILAEEAPSIGIGRAINDRLMRASQR